MKNLTIYACIFLIAAGCGSPDIQPANNKSPDTTETSENQEENTDIDIGQLRQEYVSSYKNSVQLDTAIEGKKGERIRIHGKYHCLFDNAITVPGKYNFDDTTKEFRTHNFIQDLIIILNDDTILNKAVTKQLFVHTLPKYLQEYAVLSDATFEGYDSTRNAVLFNFSLSIPLTDVGEPRKLIVTRSGEINVSQ